MTASIFLADHATDCSRCGTSPVVIARSEGLLTDTGLCGVCFFRDRSMVDPEEWNNQPDSTE